MNLVSNLGFKLEVCVVQLWGTNHLFHERHKDNAGFLLIKGLTEHFLQGNVPLENLLLEICYQRCKWLGPCLVFIFVLSKGNLIWEILQQIIKNQNILICLNQPFTGSFLCWPLELVWLTNLSHLGTRLFTSLTADFSQNMNGCFSFSKCLNWTVPWRKYSAKNLVIQLIWEDIYLFELMY